MSEKKGLLYRTTAVALVSLSAPTAVAPLRAAFTSAAERRSSNRPSAARASELSVGVSSNERFLWYPCHSDEEAWQVCQLGLRRRLHEPKLNIVLHDACLFELALPPTEDPDASGSWGLLCRAALGTVVDEAPTTPRTTPGDEATDRLLAAARERSYLLPRPGDADGEGACHLEVGSPWARCYPEYAVNLRL